MGAGLAIVSIVGGVISIFIVGPQSILGGLAAMSIGGSVFTVLVAALVAWRNSARDTAAQDVSSLQPPAGSSPLAPRET